MQIKWNEVTWYSKWGAVIFFLMVMPILCFYIGKTYQNVLNLEERPIEVINTNSTGWVKLNIEEDESIQLFRSVREYIKANDTSLLYSELVLDKRNKDWILVKVNPEIDNDFVSTQMYVKKEGGVWKVMGVGTVPTKLCAEYPELGC